MTGFSLKNPYVVVAFALLALAMGILAFMNTPTDLFPDTTPPQVVVITVEPGASAANVSHKITEVIERELNSISGLKRIVSTSRDEVSSINAEFYYYKPIGEAVVDVQNAISRIESQLPKEIKKPAIYRITNTTRPLLTIALSPKTDSAKNLRDIRLLADNQMTRSLLQVPGVADVDTFGANRPEISIRVKKTGLHANDLSIVDVITMLTKHNVNFPSGNLYTTNSEYIINTYDEFENLKDIENMPLRNKNGGILFLRDVATVELSTAEPRSQYHGNGTPAIAVNVMRLPNVGTVSTIKNVKKHIAKLEKKYPDIKFAITTDQSPVIDVNVKGMKSSLAQAIILTALVIFVFMADLRAAIVIATSIPLSFLCSFAVLWLSPFTLSMVTLSGLIISVGMVVDASIVVLENIFRHYRSMERPDALKAAKMGVEEVQLSITAGMLTTVVVLIPVMYSGGYTQRIMRPLNLMICSTLVASLLAALTVVPLLAAKLLAKPRKRNRFELALGRVDYLVDKLSSVYVGILSLALRHRFITIFLAVGVFAATMRIVPPLVGKEMMPPMDTGISIISFNTQSNMNLKEVGKVVDKVESIVKRNEHVVQISTMVGSEPGQISFGGGGKTTQSVTITIRMIPRNKRKETIWGVNDEWRRKIARVPGIRDLMVTEYGATPVSTTKAPLDVIISGPSGEILDKIADDVVARLKTVKGLRDIRRTWRRDKPQYRIEPDHLTCAAYGVEPKRVGQEVKATLKGYVVGSFDLKNYLSIPIRVRYDERDVDSPWKLEDIYIPTRLGYKQLRTLATVVKSETRPIITRENQCETIDVTAANHVVTIGHAAKRVEKRLADVNLPAGYSIEVSGTISNMAASNKRMMKALRVGLVLLFVLLLPMFRSFTHPFTIMTAIPLAVAGAFWGLLIFDKPMCKPAMMGIIFLGGTIVNNSILLLDFIIKARADGMDRENAIIHSVKLRMRPILMTTVSTVVGLLPLIFEMAVGLERMSPLGIVAASGLVAGTILTIVVIPVVYTIMDDLSAKISGPRTA